MLLCARSHRPAQSWRAQITFYEGENFRGRAFTADKQVNNFERNGFNDRTSSIVVDRGRGEFCEDADFRGRDQQQQNSAAPGTPIAHAIG